MSHGPKRCFLKAALKKLILIKNNKIGHRKIQVISTSAQTQQNKK